MLQGDLVTDGWRRPKYVTRSTCACPARAAFRTVRSTSTWRLTRPSSPTTTTPAGRGPGRCRTGRWAGCRSCRESRRRHREWSTGWPVRRWRNARRNRAPAGHPRVRRPDVHLVVRARPPRKPRAPRRGSAVARTASPITLRRRSAAPPSGWKPPATVTLPDGPVCCGLTWISTGQLRAAKRRISRSLAVLAPQLDMGTPIIGLEPSCTAVLRRDASELLHDDARAAALATSTVTFAEFLTRTDWQPPRPRRRPGVHCHQHAVLGFDADRALMAKAGIRATFPTPDVVAWLEISASSAVITRCRGQSGSGCCCPRSAKPPRPPRSSPTSSAAAHRSPMAPRAGGASGRTARRRLGPGQQP